MRNLKFALLTAGAFVAPMLGALALMSEPGLAARAVVERYAAHVGFHATVLTAEMDAPAPPEPLEPLAAPEPPAPPDPVDVAIFDGADMRREIIDARREALEEARDRLQEMKDQKIEEKLAALEALQLERCREAAERAAARVEQERHANLWEGPVADGALKYRRTPL